MEGFVKVVLVIVLIALLIVLSPVIFSVLAWIVELICKVSVITWLLILIAALLGYLIWG